MSDSFHTLLVPGLGCTPQLFESIMPGLWADGAVTVVDTCRDSSISAMAERLLASAPPRFAVVGFSMGGFVALEVVKVAPERVRALALISTSSQSDTSERTAGRQELLSRVRRDGFIEVFDSVFPDLVGAEMAALWSRMAREVGEEVFCTQLEAIINRPNYAPTLSAISCPTAIIHGGADRMVPVEYAEVSLANIPHAALTIIDGGGHMVIREQPATVSVALRTLWRDA